MSNSRDMKKKILQPESFKLTDALRACGHKEDYYNSNKYTLEEYASKTKCSKCKLDEFNDRKKRESLRLAIAQNWVKTHRITLEPLFDVSDSYSGDVEIRFFLPTGIKREE